MCPRHLYSCSSISSLACMSFELLKYFKLCSAPHHLMLILRCFYCTKVSTRLKTSGCDIKLTIFFFGSCAFMSLYIVRVFSSFINIKFFIIMYILVIIIYYRRKPLTIRWSNLKCSVNCNLMIEVMTILEGHTHDKFIINLNYYLIVSYIHVNSQFTECRL